VGYYVNNEYADAELAENPPPKPMLEKLQRNIMADHPRCVVCAGMDAWGIVFVCFVSFSCA
jgi:hypothetical protein